METAYAELVAAHAPALLRLAVMLTGRREDAEDLLQTTLLKVHPHTERLTGMAAPAAYLRRVMVNEHLSAGRALRRRVRLVPTDAVPEIAVDPPAGAVEQHDEVWRWLAGLPRQQRAVLVLRFYEDLPDAEIAALLGCGEGTVRSNASRALAALRGRLLPEPEVTP